MGILDGDPTNGGYYVSPLQGGFTGALQGLAPYLGPTRAPVSPWAALAGALGGFGQGAQNANQQNLKSRYLDTETKGKEIANQTGQLGLLGALDQFNARRALNGQEPVSTAGILGGNFSLGGGGSSPQGILGGGMPAPAAPQGMDPIAASNFASDPGNAGQPGMVSPAGKPNTGTPGVDASTMSRQQAAALAQRYMAAGYTEIAQKYMDYAMKGVEGGFENGPSGLTPIMGGPQDPRYKAQSAGAVTSATQAAELPFVGPRAAANAAGTFYGAPQKLGPGDMYVNMGAPGGPQTVAKSEFPAPGTQPGRFESAIGEQQAKVIEDARTSSTSALGTLKVLQNQADLLDKGFEPSASAGIRTSATNFLTGIGVPENFAKGIFSTNPAAFKLFQANSNELVQSVAKTLGTNPTDNDARLLAATVAQATDPKAAAQAVIQYATNKMQEKVQYYQNLHAHTFDANGKMKADPLTFDVNYAAQRARLPGANGSVVIDGHTITRVD